LQLPLVDNAVVEHGLRLSFPANAFFAGFLGKYPADQNFFG
jgi:hypothetical protein